MKFRTSEAVPLNVETISRQVNNAVIDTLAFYEESPLFQVVDERSSDFGSGTVVVSIDVNPGGNKPHYCDYQIIEFEGQDVIHVSSEIGNTWYRYNKENATVQMGKDYAAYENAQWHSTQCIISSDEQMLKETSRIDTHTDITAEYRPVVIDGNLGFQSSKIWFQGYIPLSEEDVSKFLPGGRFIEIDDIIASIVDPERSKLGRYNDQFPEIHRVPPFLQLTNDAPGHSSAFVSTLEHNHDQIHGFAHPLKEDPDGWLVFVRFGTGAEAVAKALIIQVDRESIEVTEQEGIPMINVTMLVDGETYNLSIPEDRVSWTEATAENMIRAKEINISDVNGEQRALVSMTSDELRTSISQGYYYGDMLNAVLEAYALSL